MSEEDEPSATVVSFYPTSQNSALFVKRILTSPNNSLASVFSTSAFSLCSTDFLDSTQVLSGGNWREIKTSKGQLTNNVVKVQLISIKKRMYLLFSASSCIFPFYCKLNFMALCVCLHTCVYVCQGLNRQQLHQGSVYPVDMSLYIWWTCSFIGYCATYQIVDCNRPTTFTAGLRSQALWVKLSVF